MSITVNIYYTGENGSARKFAEEMISSGTVEAKRFANIIGNEYGTARDGGAAQKVANDPVVIAINDDTEYLEEIEEKDLQMYGVNGLIERRTRNHQNALAAELDTKFFAEAKTAGTALEVPADVTDIADEVEFAIQSVETVKNDFVNGVPRNMIDVVMSPAMYGKLRNKINAIPNSNGLGQVANWEGGIFNNTMVYSSVFLPAGVDYVVMARGAIAQPVRTTIYAPKAIDLSDAIAFGLFAYKGTKAVMADLIFYKGTGESV